MIRSQLFVFMVSCMVFALVASQDCEPPKKIANFEWNNTGVKESGLYFPLGQKNDTNLMKVILYGSSLNADVDLPKICPRLRFNETNTLISGVNGTSAQFKCDPIGKNKWSLDCKHEGDKQEYNHKVYVTLTDKKSYGFAVRCWATGLKSWTVFSTKKFLHDDEQIRLLEHAKSLGFETADAFPLGYKNCH